VTIPLALGWFLSFGVGIFGLVVVILWIIGLVDLSKRPDLDRRAKWTWILLIVLIPIVGTIIYWVRRPTLPEEREKIIAARTRGRGY
jgi:Phospholipase_D-nuclease N-terminal